MKKNENEEKVLDIHEFDELIDRYQSAQNGGTSAERVEARFELRNAYRRALAALAK